VFASINRPGWRDGAASTGNPMRWIALLPAMALIACGGKDEGAEAEKRYEMVERTGTKGELCAAGREVAEAYLRAGDEKKYREWHTTSGVQCQLAELTSPDLPATESESYKRAKADAEASARAMDDAAQRAFDEATDEASGEVADE
jgi:hypothetical protein